MEILYLDGDDKCRYSTWYVVRTACLHRVDFIRTYIDMHKKVRTINLVVLHQQVYKITKKCGVMYGGAFNSSHALNLIQF